MHLGAADQKDHGYFVSANLFSGVCVRNLLKPSQRKVAPRVPDGVRIYAIGDVHGRADLLHQLMMRIDADLSANPYPADRVIQIFLGDYIDRGPESREVLDLLIDRSAANRIICLKGNHEVFMQEFLKEPAVLTDWKRLGGLETLLSYGVKPSMSTDRLEQKKLADSFNCALPDDHRRFLSNLELSFTCGDFLFVHAGVRPNVPLRRQNEHDLLWIRDEFLLHEGDFGKVIIHGHTPVMQPDVRPNRINIDTGAYATGQLTCLVLEADQIDFI